jgi:hypothetical protein
MVLVISETVKLSDEELQVFTEDVHHTEVCCIVCGVNVLKLSNFVERLTLSLTQILISQGMLRKTMSYYCRG